LNRQGAKLAKKTIHDFLADLATWRLIPSCSPGFETPSEGRESPSLARSPIRSGASGAFGVDYGLRRECEDLEAILHESGARSVFGLSSGAIVALHAALTLPIEKLALYEPPLLTPGSSHIGWVPRYARELDAGKLASAMVTLLEGVGDPSVLRALPRFLLVPLVRLAINADERRTERGYVPLKALIPTMRFDARLVAETEGALERFGAVRARVLLLGGEKSAPYLRRALDALGRVLPGAERVELRGIGHLAADNGGAPERVAAKLAAFFASSP
jgi:pimeloyl-ACP methyl ester carboxylesterase